jgi:uncharacterized membrane protein
MFLGCLAFSVSANMTRITTFWAALIAASFIGDSGAFVASSAKAAFGVQQQLQSNSALHIFGKAFEESGPLGKGITVGKVQVSLNTNDKTIFSVLEDCAKHGGSDSPDLAEMAHEICLTLIRRSDDWTGACSTSEWFSEKDGGKAERCFNTLANAEASKYEKEYIGNSESDEATQGFTSVVVSLIIELQGDQTKFDRAGLSFGETKEVLSSIAADVMVDEGFCVNAMEAFWTPSDTEETMTKMEMIVDFPELMPL